MHALYICLTLPIPEQIRQILCSLGIFHPVFSGIRYSIHRRQ